MNMYLKMYVIESVLSSVRRNNRSTGRTVRIYCTKSHQQKNSEKLRFLDSYDLTKFFKLLLIND